MTSAIHTEILIAAPPDAVWAVLGDFAGHDRWDPLLAIDGKLAVGERLTVRFKNGMTIRPAVTEAQNGRTLEWLGKLVGSWLFSGRHRFELVPEGDGTRFVHSESFTGILLPFTKRILAETEKGFGAFNRALKAEAEGAWAASSG